MSFINDDEAEQTAREINRINFSYKSSVCKSYLFLFDFVYKSTVV